uniref:(California timema) hypothetical protein n=1 Tax=Timema californicum TaxID=61474 RepID=A0A7R9J825_TIMCA|nr:unnamed protein product [Timema californicum]
MYSAQSTIVSDRTTLNGPSTTKRTRVSDSQLHNNKVRGGGQGGGRGTLWVPVWPHRLHIPKGGPDRKEGLPMVLSEVLIEGSLNLTGVSISSVFVGICPACSNGSQVISSLNAVFQALNSRLDELLLRDEQERGEVAIRDL